MTGGDAGEIGRFQLVRDLFEKAGAMPDGVRASFIAASAPDASIAAEVMAMLAAADEPPGVLEQGALGTAAGVLPAICKGMRLGAYELVEQIGEGGMGVVFRARRVDGAFDKEVAIKLTADPILAMIARKNFQAEREILARLEHPNIARILDGGTTVDGALYLVMELVAGVPIDEYCESQRLSVRERLRLYLKVCDAVQYAHAHLVVHRDLKPSNILVTQGSEVKLLDFGIAKVLEPGGADAMATRTIRLTPRYASPEQLRGQPVSTAADVYSLGVVLYGLLTGRRSPYRTPLDGSVEALILEACSESTIPELPSRACPPDFRRVVHGDLDSIVLQALRKEPRLRYPSVESMRDDIERHLEGRPVQARGAASAYRIQKWLRRHWAPVFALAMLFVLLVAGILVALRDAELQRASRAQAERLIAEAQQARAAAEEARRKSETEEREAKRQRERAERTSRDVRELSTSLLFDIYDKIREVAGAGPVRKLTLDRALDYLQRTERDAADDPELQDALASAYERLGSRMGSTLEWGAEGSRAAIPVFEKALRLRKQLEQRDASRSDWLLRLAQLQYSAGNLYIGFNEVGTAERYYLASLEKAHKLPPTATSTIASESQSYDGLCRVATLRSDAVASRRYCGLAVSAFERIPARDLTDDKRHFGILALGRLANSKQNDGDIVGALTTYRKAIEQQTALAKAHPENLGYRRSVGVLRFQMMPLLAKLKGNGDDAIAGYGEIAAGLRSALAAEPGELQTSLYLAVALRRQGEAMLEAGRAAEGEVRAREALGVLRSLAEKPNAGVMELNEYADALLKCRFPALRDDKAALDTAQKLSAKVKTPNPALLDTLAWALFRNGRKEEAVKTVKQAIAMTPPASPLRKELDASLKAFGE